MSDFEIWALILAVAVALFVISVASGTNDRARLAEEFREADGWDCTCQGVAAPIAWQVDENRPLHGE